MKATLSKATLWMPAIAGALLLSACGGAEETPTEGTVAWTREFDSEGAAMAVHVAAGPNGNVYVAGMTGAALAGQVNAGGSDAFVRRYDSTGQEVWTRQFGTEVSDIARLVWTDPMGNVYVGGGTEGALPGQTSSDEYEDTFIRKYDSAGVELWTRQFETPSAEFEAAWDGKGNGYVVGFEGREEAEECEDVFIRKYDAAGQEVWTTRLLRAECPSVVEADEAGNVYVAGTTDEPPDQPQFRSTRSNVFISKYDPAGEKLWTEQFGSGSEVSVASVAVDDSGGVYVAGWTDAENERGSKERGLYT